jgi:hypothetical protein
MQTISESRERFKLALERIAGIQIGPPKVTDHDWLARLMQSVAAEALKAANAELMQERK